ncbi:hypothetical protein [Crocosphaera sp.]
MTLKIKLNNYNSSLIIYHNHQGRSHFFVGWVKRSATQQKTDNGIK